MKFACLTALLLAVWTLAAAPTVALLGRDREAQNAADQLLAESAGRYEFVERGAVDAIQREAEWNRPFADEKLARLAGADLFVVLETVSPGKLRLTAFESTCGFRLLRRIVTGDEAAKTLAQAFSLLDAPPERTRMISIAGVRSNLHYSLGAQAKAISASLLEAADRLNAIVLERDYLVELLRENQLTGRWAKAAAASEILHFELNPGDTAKSFTVSGYFTDPEENIVCRSESSPGGIDAMFTVFAAHLATPPADGKHTLKTEAARFAREAGIARRNGDNPGASQKGFAAFALDNNPAYLEWNSYWPQNETPKLFPYRMALLERIAANPEQFKEYSFHHFAVRVLENFSRERAELAPEQRRQYENFRESNRELFLTLDDAPYPVDRLLGRFIRIQPYLYGTDAIYLAEKSSAWQAVMAELDAPRFREIPEDRRQWFCTYQFYNALTELLPLQTALPPQWARQLSRRFAESGEPYLKPLPFALQANELISGDAYDEEKFLALCEEYYKACAEAKVKSPGNFAYGIRKIGQHPGLWEKVTAIAGKYR